MPEKTRLLKIESTLLDTSDRAAIAEAAALILAGQLVAFPTETVYGLGANAFDSKAVAGIFTAKGRPASDPVIVHVHEIAQATEVANSIPELGKILMQAFWPGPLTLVLSRAVRIPPNVSAGLDTIAVRMPQHPIALALIQAAGIPIAAPSANIFGHSSPTTAQHVLDDLDGRIPLVLDGGPTSIGVESTIVDLTNENPRLLRPGGISLERLQVYAPRIEVITRYAQVAEGATPAPGMLLRHYSPRALLYLYEGSLDAMQVAIHEALATYQRDGKRVGLLLADEDREYFADLSNVPIITLGSILDLEQVARNLFAGLRDLDNIDSRGIDVMLARTFPAKGIGLAIRDRMIRAAEGRVIAV